MDTALSLKAAFRACSREVFRTTAVVLATSLVTSAAYILSGNSEVTAVAASGFVGGYIFTRLAHLHS